MGGDADGHPKQLRLVRSIAEALYRDQELLSIFNKHQMFYNDHSTCC
jgi:hypothetical protein